MPARNARCAVVESSERSASTSEEEEDLQIEGIDKNYCDEFVCTSSPAVEQNLRALARDLTRLRTWTLSLFAKDVRYQDRFRSFTGKDKYVRLKFVADCIGDPKVLVTKLRMLDRGTAVVSWRLRGSIGPVPIDLDLESEFQLDLITGRVMRHSERWDLGRCSAPARLIWTARRAAWSAGQAAMDAKDAGGTVLGDRSGGDDAAQAGIYADPSDPTKMFQQDDNTFRDAVTFATFLAILWVFASAYEQLEKLP
ncbi:hypothetical protein WJX81_001762 [Elliptochloris bilobata]|uniref:AT1G65230-like protein n=1 Tax=Elliptochloris bilobata TaxID=381761 RepID=A0AAW1Q9B2_9CHLO